MTVHDVSEASFAALSSKGTVLVQFSAKWCGPCKLMTPRVSKVSAQRPDVTFLHVDIEDCPSLPSLYALKKVPTVLVFRDGQVVSRREGLISESDLATMLG